MQHSSRKTGALHSKIILAWDLVSKRFWVWCQSLYQYYSAVVHSKLFNNAYRRVLGYVKSNGASNMFVYNQVENIDAHNRHIIIIYCLGSRILDSDNSIVV